jgi:hypothetical protein
MIDDVYYLARGHYIKKEFLGVGKNVFLGAGAVPTSSSQS